MGVKIEDRSDRETPCFARDVRFPCPTNVYVQVARSPILTAQVDVGDDKGFLFCWREIKWVCGV